MKKFLKLIKMFFILKHFEKIDSCAKLYKSITL